MSWDQEVALAGLHDELRRDNLAVLIVLGGLVGVGEAASLLLLDRRRLTIFHNHLQPEQRYQLVFSSFES